MALENATTINELIVTNPTSGDPIEQGDDHIRLIKETLKNTFPSVTGVVQSSHTDLNKLVGASFNTDDLTKIGAITASADEINILDGATVSTSELNTLDGVTVNTSEINELDGVTSNIQGQFNDLNGRNINTGLGLEGGGDLSVDRTIGIVRATQEQAEAGDDNSSVMTPQRTKEAIDAQVTPNYKLLEKKSLSGSEVKFDTLPFGTSEIKIGFINAGVSGAGVGDILVQLITGFGVTLTGLYTSTGSVTGRFTKNSDRGFILPTNDQSRNLTGSLTLIRHGDTDWFAEYSMAEDVENFIASGSGYRSHFNIAGVRIVPTDGNHTLKGEAVVIYH